MFLWHSAPHSASSEVVALLRMLVLSALTQMVSLAGHFIPVFLSVSHFRPLVGGSGVGVVVSPNVDEREISAAPSTALQSTCIVTSM